MAEAYKLVVAEKVNGKFRERKTNIRPLPFRGIKPQETLTMSLFIRLPNKRGPWRAKLFLG